MKRLLSLLLLILIPGSLILPAPGARGQGLEESFFEANRAYREGRYREAIDGYRGLILSGHRNGHLYYNLGNAYLREGALGEAILAYERARLFMPRDGDLNFNLRYALDQTRDAIPDPRGFIGQTFFWLHDLTAGELLWAFALVNVLFWGILLVRLFKRPEWSYYGLLLFLIFWVIGGLSFGLKWYETATDDRAVILEEETHVLAGPESGDTVLFRLHQGAVVHYERSEDGWVLIRLPDEKRGWVKGGAVERIMKSPQPAGRVNPPLNKGGRHHL